MEAFELSIFLKEVIKELIEEPNQEARTRLTPHVLLVVRNINGQIYYKFYCDKEDTFIDPTYNLPQLLLTIESDLNWKAKQIIELAKIFEKRVTEDENV